MRVASLGLFVVFAWVVLLSACMPVRSDEQDSYSAMITLLPYSTEPMAIPTPEQNEPSVLSSPTSETVTYTVVGGDSLSAIALRYGIALDALLNANPNVNPNVMSIGTKLIIPPINNSTGKGTIITTGLPTPVIQSTVSPDCYRVEVDLWICFLMINNNQPYAVESVSGEINAKDSLSKFTAACPLDFIPAGDSLPLIANISISEIAPAFMEGMVISAIPVKEHDPRYGSTTITRKTIVYLNDSRVADVTGEILLTEGGTLRLLGYAIDDQNHVLGYRIWDASASLAAGKSATFNFRIYSLAGKISTIHLIAQSRLE